MPSNFFSDDNPYSAPRRVVDEEKRKVAYSELPRRSDLAVVALLGILTVASAVVQFVNLLNMLRPEVIITSSSGASLLLLVVGAATNLCFGGMCLWTVGSEVYYLRWRR